MNAEDFVALLDDEQAARLLRELMNGIPPTPVVAGGAVFIIDEEGDGE